MQPFLVTTIIITGIILLWVMSDILTRPAYRKLKQLQEEQFLTRQKHISDRNAVATKALYGMVDNLITTYRPIGETPLLIPIKSVKQVMYSMKSHLSSPAKLLLTREHLVLRVNGEEHKYDISFFKIGTSQTNQIEQ